jgi:hypothetical protein
VTAATAADKPTTKPLPPAPYSTKRKYKPKSKKTAATAAAADTDADVAASTDGGTAATASGSSSTAKDTAVAAVAEVSIMSRTPAGALKRRRNATDVLMVCAFNAIRTIYCLLLSLLLVKQHVLTHIILQDGDAASITLLFRHIDVL